MKAYRKRYPISFILCLILCLLIPGTAWANADQIPQSDVDEVYEILTQLHVSSKEIQKGDIEAMLQQLGDPYTQYFTRDEFRSFINEVDGSFTGIGMMVDQQDGYTIVMRVFEDSPAEKAGLLKGDKIYAVDGIEMKGLPVEEVTSRIKGEEGTKVNLTVLRGDEKISFEITRAKIQIPLVQAEWLDEGIGYIQILSFGDETDEQVQEALEEFEAKGLKGLILDVRGNPGGRLDTVIQIADLFIGEGPVIWVKNNHNQLRSYDVRDGEWWDKPLVVLVDQYSASASEILSASLKDYGLATVIGNTTFGKGTVQSLLTLSSGNALKVTVEEYFSPNQTKINGIGVKPHIEIEQPDEQLSLATEWVQGIDSIKFTQDGRMQLNDLAIADYEDIAKLQDEWLVSLYRLHLMSGGELSWDPKAMTATLTIHGETRSFTLGKENVQIFDSRMYVPVRLLDDFAGFDVIEGTQGNLILELAQ